MAAAEERLVRGLRDALADADLIREDRERRSRENSLAATAVEEALWRAERDAVAKGIDVPLVTDDPGREFPKLERYGEQPGDTHAEFQVTALECELDEPAAARVRFMVLSVNADGVINRLVGQQQVWCDTLAAAESLLPVYRHAAALLGLPEHVPVPTSSGEPPAPPD